jgi:addiction module RelE/StbE family toxin
LTKIIWDQGFKKIYQKRVRNDAELKKRFWTMVRLFSKSPFDRRLRTHKLTGKLEGLWSFSVAYDCRVIFRFLSKDEVLLIDIGGHDEVY